MRPGRKPWRQKGTGHARQGSTRAPQWTGGGVVFAPVPRDYSFKINKKEKRAALKSALTYRVEAQKFVVLDELKLEAIKTKDFVKVLNNLNVSKALVVMGDKDVVIEKSAANVPDVKTTQATLLNVYDSFFCFSSFTKSHSTSFCLAFAIHCVNFCNFNAVEHFHSFQPFFRHL